MIAVGRWPLVLCAGAGRHGLKLRGKPGPQSLKICLQRRADRGVQKLALVVIFKPVIWHDGRLGFGMVGRKTCLHLAHDLMLVTPLHHRSAVGSHTATCRGWVTARA